MNDLLPIQLTDNANTNRYAVELDAERARQAKAAGINTIHANVFDVTAKVESCSLLYLNPPYDSEVSSFGNKRMELLFLRRTLRWLVNGGILLMVVPHAQLQECVPLRATISLSCVGVQGSSSPIPGL
jgi:16S rRNA G966 N2-methylase RsmD